MANAFFSTFPRRPRRRGREDAEDIFCMPDLTTGDVSFPTIFGDLQTTQSRQLLKKMLNYFDTVDCDEPCGHLYVRRHK